MSSPFLHLAMFSMRTFLVVSFSFCLIFLINFFFNKTRSASGEIYERHLVEGSDRRFVDEIIFFLPSYLKVTHERYRNCFLSGLDL